MINQNHFKSYVIYYTKHLGKFKFTVCLFVDNQLTNEWTFLGNKHFEATWWLQTLVDCRSSPKIPNNSPAEQLENYLWGNLKEVDQRENSIFTCKILYSKLQRGKFTILILIRLMENFALLICVSTCSVTNEETWYWLPLCYCRLLLEWRGTWWGPTSPGTLSTSVSRAVSSGPRLCLPSPGSMLSYRRGECTSHR